jgi:hypothetical protein
MNVFQTWFVPIILLRFLIAFSVDFCFNGQCQSWGDVSNPISFVLQEFVVA